VYRGSLGLLLIDALKHPGIITLTDDIAILPIGIGPSQPSVLKKKATRAANYSQEEDAMGARTKAYVL
jgi:hypothetical protein